MRSVKVARKDGTGEMEGFPNVGVLIAIVAPLVILELGLLIFALADLIRRDETQLRHLPKWGWVVIVVVINFIGPILYLLIGREEA